MNIWGFQRSTKKSRRRPRLVFDLTKMHLQQRNLKILQVSTFDIRGGAERIAWNLFQAYRSRGYDSWLAVGHKYSDDPNVFVIPQQDLSRKWFRFWQHVHSRLLTSEGNEPPGWSLSRIARVLADPGRSLETYRGIENFRFPGTWRLLELNTQRPDILHCHNLHGEYFDLRALSWLSQDLPLFLTLHDTWLLSGHCAYSLGCERWKTGCGSCPDLEIPPAVPRDATALNWRRKREIYAKSRLFVATPSRWLMDQVMQSILAPAMVEARVIPNGVDRSVFRPGNRLSARKKLGLPEEAQVILFAANTIHENRFKDFQALREAVAKVAGQMYGQKLLFIALGEDRPAEQIEQAEVQFIPFQKDPEEVARYYQAADVYAHAAHADTFPNTILEALACATPVVATAVGGIPEQVEDGQSGFLVLPADSQALAARLLEVLTNFELRQRLSWFAADSARRRFDLNQQVEAYLAWYHERELQSGGWRAGSTERALS